MVNPNGNYPGRQIFVGSLVTGELAFAYFVSGRSTKSQSRFASPFLAEESAVRIKPTDPKEEFDIFRHYQAVKIDPVTGTAIISNSQAPVDTLFEAYTRMPEKDRGSALYLQKLLSVIGPEYDNDVKPTSRIVGIVNPNQQVNMLGITSVRDDANTRAYSLNINGLRHVSTYNGEIDYQNYDPKNLHVHENIFSPKTVTAQELADEIFEMSDYTDPKYGELRVCSIAGVRNGKGPGGWDMARRNRYDVKG